jgi:hypothetical protein
MPQRNTDQDTGGHPQGQESFEDIHSPKHTRNAAYVRAG